MDDNTDDTSSIPQVNVMSYGPADGENWKDANVGPLGNLLTPDQIAISPNLAKQHGIKLGDWVEVAGKPRQVADWSFYHPNAPTSNTVEIRDQGHVKTTSPFRVIPPEEAQERGLPGFDPKSGGSFHPPEISNQTNVPSVDLSALNANLANEQNGIPDIGTLPADAINDAIQSQPASALFAGNIPAAAIENATDNPPPNDNGDQPTEEQTDQSDIPQEQKDALEAATQEQENASVPIRPPPSGTRFLHEDEQGNYHYSDGTIVNPLNKTITQTDPAGNMWMMGPNMAKPVKIKNGTNVRLYTNQTTGEVWNMSDPEHPKKVEFKNPATDVEVDKAAFDKLPDKDKQKAQDYADYHLGVSPYGISRDKELNRLYPYVKYLNPTFDTSNYQAHKQMNVDYTMQKQGTSGGMIRSFNQSLTHIGTLNDLASQLSNGWSKRYNSIKNFIYSEAGKPYVAQYEYAANIVATEMARAYKGGVPDQGDIERQKEYLNSATSPEALQGVLRNSAIPMIGGALENLDAGYEAGMGKPLADNRLIYGPAREQLGKMGIGTFAGRAIGPGTGSSTTATQVVTSPTTGKSFTVGQGYPYHGKMIYLKGGNPDEGKNWSDTPPDHH